jgi:four helix bundle protein
MKDNNIIQTKSYQFAKRIVKLYLFLSKEKHEFNLSKQVLRSGTSIGANVEEAIGAHSKKDFLSKITIAYKEARETNYWLRLLKDCEILDEKLATNLLIDSDELIKVLGSIIRTMKKQIPNS